MLFNTDKTKQCATFPAYVAFNKATNGQTDIKHEREYCVQRMRMLQVLVSVCSPYSGKFNLLGIIIASVITPQVLCLVSLNKLFFSLETREAIKSIQCKIFNQCMCLTFTWVKLLKIDWTENWPGSRGR